MLQRNTYFNDGQPFTSSLTMTLWFIKSCLPKEKLSQWEATKLAIRKSTQEGIQMSAEVAQDKFKSLSLSPLPASSRMPERFPGALFSSLRWEKQWIWLWGPPHCQRKIAPFINKLLEDSMHCVIIVSIMCDLPGVKEGAAFHGQWQVD